MGMTFTLFQLSRTSPDHQGFQITESGLATMSATSLSALGWIPSGPASLCGLRPCERLQASPSSKAGESIRGLSHQLHLVTWGSAVLVKTEAKKVWRALALSASLVTRFPALFSHGPLFSLYLCLLQKSIKLHNALFPEELFYTIVYIKICKYGLLQICV